jgi:hypothetical protein
MKTEQIHPLNCWNSAQEEGGEINLLTTTWDEPRRVAMEACQCLAHPLADAGEPRWRCLAGHGGGSRNPSTGLQRRTREKPQRSGAGGRRWERRTDGGA